MSRRRIFLLVALWLLPVLFLIGVGSYALWERGWWFYVWWPLAGCLAAAYLLGWYWQRSNRLLPATNDPAGHWTDRDRNAWKLVEARAAQVKDVPIQQLENLHFYLDAGRAMAEELACFYHPNATDPLSRVTLPELLTVAELATHDLGELVDQYLPGGHLLTVSDWRRTRKATDWYRTASNIYWAVAALFNPVQTGLRYVAAQLGVSQPWQQLQQGLADWFYTAYLHRLGTYLIELYSGRLGVGAERYRALLERYRTATAPASRERERPEHDHPPVAHAPGSPEEVQAPQVTLALFGQVNAGKSSVINALLGEQRAKTDVLPATAAVTRYQLRPPQAGTQLVLLDTVGYGHEGPKADDLKATETAARQADVLLLVLHALNPARQADVQMVERLKAWFADRPDLRMPPLLAVLTHIDLLSPALEWSPPYNWHDAQRPKERAIAAAVAATRDQLGAGVADVIPVCTAEGKVFNVQEELLPAILIRLDEAHAVALLRCLREEMDQGQVRKVFRQLLAAGTEVAKVALVELLKPKP
jgi:predicted GTPase